MIQLDRRQQLVIILLVGVILFGGGYRFAQMKERAAEEGKPALEASSEKKPKDLQVHVAGAVSKPGVYHLLQGSRVIDAVNMAGPTGEAELDSLKLASPITDGQTVYVPLKQAAVQSGSTTPGSQPGAPVSPTSGAGRSPFSPQAGANITGLININTADQAQLDTLPGIGPALAQRIIQYRETNGLFRAIEDLKDVSGIGDKKFEDLKDRIMVR